MRYLLGILTCVIALGAVPAQGETDPIDKALKVVLPDRDLSKAALKVVDQVNGCYAVGDSLEVTKDGRVRTMNGVVIQRLGGPNEAPRYSSITSPRMILKFANPVRMPSDLAGNKIVGIE